MALHPFSKTTFLTSLITKKLINIHYHNISITKKLINITIVTGLRRWHRTSYSISVVRRKIHHLFKVLTIGNIIQKPYAFSEVFFNTTGHKK